MSVRQAIQQFFIGAYHSFYIFIRLFSKNEPSPSEAFEKSDSDTKHDAYINSIQTKIKMYCILNGSIFFSSLCYVDYIILPMLNWCVYKIFPVSYHDLANYLIRTGFKILILYFWSLSIILFYSLFQYMKFNNDDEKKGNIFTSAFRLIKNVIIKATDITTIVLFEIILLVESIVYSMIPLQWLASLLYHTHFAFFLSVMVFDFKWSLKGWNTQQKIDFIESRCMYFLGFGLVLSILFNIPGSIIYNAVISSFFIPIVVYNGMQTRCEDLEPTSVRLPVFDFQVGIIQFVNKKLTGSKTIETVLKKVN